MNWVLKIWDPWNSLDQAEQFYMDIAIVRGRQKKPVRKRYLFEYNVFNDKLIYGLQTQLLYLEND